MQVDEATFGFGDQGSIASTITELRRAPRGQYYITLENGQIWREIEAKRRSRFGYEVGDGISITRSRVGAYRIRVDESGYSNTVKRIE